MPRKQESVPGAIYAQDRNTLLMIGAQAVASIGFITLLTDGYIHSSPKRIIVVLIFIATAFICNKIAWYNPEKTALNV